MDEVLIFGFGALVGALVYHLIAGFFLGRLSSAGRSPIRVLPKLLPLEVPNEGEVEELGLLLPQKPVSDRNQRGKAAIRLRKFLELGLRNTVLNRAPRSLV